MPNPTLRPGQQCPLPFIWAIIGGRGSGKTYAASRHVLKYCQDLPDVEKNKIVRVAFVSDVFTHAMFEGESGILDIAPKSHLNYNRTLGKLEFNLKNGRKVVINSFTSERSDRLRGPQHHLTWLEEPPLFVDANVEQTKTTYQNVLYGTCLGTNPHIIATMTPTPCVLVKSIVNSPLTIVTKMSTFDNSDNLPIALMNQIYLLPKTSRTYHQEIMAEVLVNDE